MSETRTAPWVAADWRAETERWITSELARLGGTATGPVTEFRRRSWSILLHVETDAGRHWIKQNCPSQAFEARLLALLSQVSPARVLTPLAVEDRSGRMLTADQGPTLRDRGPADAATWTDLLVDFGRLQRETATAVRDSDIGLTTLEPADAVAYLDHWTDYWRGRPDGDPGRMPDNVAQHLDRVRPGLVEDVARIATLGLPLAVEHSDLHDNNAFAPPADDPTRPPQVFDFGDATLACPLSSLLIPMRSFGEVGLEPDDQQRVVDAYLEVWSDLVALSELRAAVPAAVNLGVLGRHESWRRTVGWRDPVAPYRDDFDDAPVQWLSLLGRPLD